MMLLHVLFVITFKYEVLKCYTKFIVIYSLLARQDTLYMNVTSIIIAFKYTIVQSKY